MKRFPLAILPFLFAVLCGSLVLQCANPLDEEPLRWRTKAEIPVTNESFIIGEEFDNLFKFDNMDILRVFRNYSGDPSVLQADTIKGDTVVFSILQTDTSRYENHQDTLEDKLYHVTLGPIPISGAADVEQVFSVPPVAGSFSVPLTIAVDRVYRVEFYDTLTNVLRVNIHNPSSSSVSNVSFGIAGLDTATAGTLGAGESAEIELFVGGKALNHAADLLLSGSTDGAAGKSIEISFSLNGLCAASLRVDDHLVRYTQEFVNAYELTDTVAVDYIDIGDGFFHYSITNHTGIELRVRGVHEHLWITSFAEERGYNSYRDLENLSAVDSSQNYLGAITSGEVVAPPVRMQKFSSQNLSSCRLFPEWNPEIEKSITRVRYYVSTGTPRGDTITLSATDSLVFTIRTTHFKFNEFLATVMESYDKTGDTQMVAINLPWDESIKDSLRGKFILQKVYGDVFMQAGIPERAFIDSMWLDFAVFPADSPSVVNSERTSMVNVKRDTTFLRTLDLTGVTNCYPDSIGITARMHIPKGTRMRVVNDLKLGDPDYNNYIGRMIISLVTRYRLNALLDWEVRGVANMDLGSGRFEMLKPFRYVRKLEQRRAFFNMDITNNSNLNIFLFALIAPHHLMDTLDSMPANDVYRLIKNPVEAQERGFVNFLGAEGVCIPPRDPNSSMYNSIALNHDQLETVLSSDSCSWRWWLQFLEQDRDALIDTDYIKINSSFLIEGINNTDSLLIW